MRTHFSKNQTYPSRQARWHKDWHYSCPQSHSISSDSLSPSRSCVRCCSFHVTLTTLAKETYIDRLAVELLVKLSWAAERLRVCARALDEVMEAFLMAVSEPSLLQSLWCFFHSCNLKLVRKMQKRLNCEEE